MMKMNKMRIIAAAAALSVSCIIAGAQTAGFLNVNPDPVSLGMGGIGTTLESTPYAMWNNAAASALDDDDFQIGAVYSLWQPSATANNVAAVAGYGKVTEYMTVSAGIRYFGYSPYDITDGSTGMVTGRFTPVELLAEVGLGFRILPVLSVGANIGYVHSDLGGPEKGRAVSVDFGALLDFGFIRAALTVSDIGSRISYGTGDYALPSNLRIGVGTVQSIGDGDRHSIYAGIDGGMGFDGTSFFAGIGAQYEWNGLLRVSAGYHYGDAERQFFGSFASLGAGISIIGISVNASYLFAVDGVSSIGNTFAVGVSYAF